MNQRSFNEKDVIRNINWILLGLAACLLAGCKPAPLYDNLTPEAENWQVDRVEPPCWWTGMKTPLQVMVHGEGIGDYDVRFVGLKGVKVKEVHRADSPNYLFIDIDIKAGAKPGTGRLLFRRDTSIFAVSYGIKARPDDQGRRSFSSEDLSPLWRTKPMSEMMPRRLFP